MAGETHYNDSSTWRKMSEIHYNDSGTWRDLSEVHYNDSGTWRKVFEKNTIPKIVDNASLLSGIWAYYKGYNNTNDATGNGRTGTLFGGTTYSSSGFFDSAFNLDGSGDGFSSANFDPNGIFSVSMWVKRTSTSVQDCMIGQYDDDTGDYDFAFWIDTSNRVNVWQEISGVDDDGTGSVISLTTNWEHWVIICVAGGGDTIWQVYRNGISVFSDVLNRNFDVITSRPLRFGYNNDLGPNSPPTSDLSGLICEIGIWSRALTSIQVGTLFNMGTGMTYD